MTTALTRTVLTLSTPRVLEQAKHAPLGPEGIYLDESRGILYVADFVGLDPR